MDPDKGESEISYFMNEYSFNYQSAKPNVKRKL
jgi:hypothetical protein